MAQAARQALGDLGKLGSALEAYVRSFAFYALRAKIVDDPARGELSFLIHYLHATLNMGPQETRESLAPVEQSLRRATALNYDFAPAYALLAEVAAYRSGDYAGALPLARRAVALEPGVVRHRLSVGRLLSAMGKYDEASLEGNRALAAARSEADRQAAQQFLATLIRPSPPPVATTPSADVAGEPVPGAGSLPVRVAEVAGSDGATVVSTKGVIVSMSCRPAGELLFVVETPSGRLSLRADVTPNLGGPQPAGGAQASAGVPEVVRVPVDERVRERSLPGPCGGVARRRGRAGGSRSRGRFS